MTTTEPTTKRICVVGLFANQARMVARKTAHLASAQLRFIDGNPAHRPDPLPDAVDYVIFSRFTDHSRYAEARAKYAPDTVFFCKGGGFNDHPEDFHPHQFHRHHNKPHHTTTTNRK